MCILCSWEVGQHLRAKSVVAVSCHLLRQPLFTSSQCHAIAVSWLIGLNPGPAPDDVELLFGFPSAGNPLNWNLGGWPLGHTGRRVDDGRALEETSHRRSDAPCGVSTGSTGAFGSEQGRVRTIRGDAGLEVLKDALMGGALKKCEMHASWVDGWHRLTVTTCFLPFLFLGLCGDT
ncbi:hypothetical protein BGZ63DRAFT_19309 [Mariannaea sp. PMI_226]|nr:hypothetical protein BGZ63DRAFT_19309 [Mariannaea sp. PMI_226]